MQDAETTYALDCSLAVVGLAAFAATLVVCRCGTLELRQMESSLRQEKVPEDCLEKGNLAGRQEERKRLAQSAQVLFLLMKLKALPQRSQFAAGDSG